MSKLHLTFACGEYDRTLALKDGSIQPEGIDINYITMGPEEIFWRMLRYEEFEASEMSFSSYLLERARGKTRLVALPVFVSRVFRHGYIFINTESGILRPEDLVGKRVGVPEYQMTAALWQRGFLQHDYGVSPDKVLWLTGGLEQPGRKEKLELHLPPGIRVETIPEDKSLSSMLASGEIDALCGARPPSSFLKGSSKLRRLFPDYEAVELEYYRRTRLFPIMHTVVIREEVLEKHRWVADSLYKALCQAKDQCLEAMRNPGTLKYAIPWLIPEIERVRQVFGDDWWPYGVEANRPSLEAAVQYSYEQGLSETKLEVESLFPQSTLEGFKT
ncbi:MAG: ABC transporter substrate-binding protein [Chloroflexi bacterium]|nr:ABC transporter substrate-binding protein [Chloroflexota bacterium]